MLGALGGARPTGLVLVDVVLLGLGGVAAAACARRARTIPVYVAAGVAVLCQPAVVPLVLGCVALAAAFARRFRRGSALFGALAGGLTWAATVGAPFLAGAVPIWVPLVALSWVGWSAWRHGSRRFRARFSRTAVAFGSVMVVGVLLGGLAVVTARLHVDRGADLVDSGLDAAREGDSDGAVADLRAARRVLARGEGTLGAAWARPAWLVPGVSQNLRVLESIVSEVRTLAQVGITTAERADIGSLRASAGQIDLAAVRAVSDPLVDVLHQLRASGRRLASLEDGWLAFPVADRLSDVQAEIFDAVTSVELAIDGVDVAPSLLGGDGPATYLVLFTTPVEARARTGFPGNFAEVTFADGRFDMTRFGRISELVLPAGGASLSLPPDFARRYDRFGITRQWRNITLSPDFPTVASVAAQLYRQSGGPEVDGVMSVDPVALAALLNFTGPIAVPGIAEPLDAKNAAQFLLRDQYVDLTDNPERIDALEALAEVAFDRLTTVTLPGPRDLGAILGPVVDDGHLQLATFDPAQMAFLDRLDITGRYPAVERDFVGVTTSNAAGNKIDLFLRRSLSYDVRWDPSTGALRATATITLTNEAPATGLPPYVIGNALGGRPLERKLPDGWNNTFLTLYTPWDVVDATLNGQPLALERLDELGRWALSTFVPLGPGESATITVDLEGVLPDAGYRLDLAAQPQVQPEQAHVRVRVVGAGSGSLRSSGPVDVAGGAAEGTFPLVSDTTIGVRRR